MNIRDMEALANRMGLVPMLMLQDAAPYRKDKVAGFIPETALKLFNEKLAVPDKMRGARPADSAPRSHSALIRQAGDRDSRPTDANFQDVAVPGNAEIEIPSDWRETHHMVRHHLAARLAGIEVADLKAKAKEAGVEKIDDYATTVIEKEVARRAAAPGGEEKAGEKPAAE